jgi:hypothetical protein
MSRKAKKSDDIGCGTWFLAIVVIGSILRLFQGDDTSTNSSNLGKPYDMSQAEWEATTSQIREGVPRLSEADVEKAARAVWESVKKQRSGHYSN